MYLLRSRSLRWSSLDTFLWSPGLWGSSFDAFLAFAQPLGEQLGSISCGHGAFWGAASMCYLRSRTLRGSSFGSFGVTFPYLVSYNVGLCCKLCFLTFLAPESDALRDTVCAENIVNTCVLASFLFFRRIMILEPSREALEVIWGGI